VSGRQGRQAGGEKWSVGAKMVTGRTLCSTVGGSGRDADSIRHSSSLTLLLIPSTSKSGRGRGNGPITDDQSHLTGPANCPKANKGTYQDIHNAQSTLQGLGGSLLPCESWDCCVLVVSGCQFNLKVCKRPRVYRLGTSAPP
jgi:hypothetical protein